MVNHTYPVRWMGRQAVVALPEHIDVSNASQIREELLWLINRGAAALIADMTATLSCDYSGADAVMQLYQVHGEHGEDPTEGHWSKQYPWPPVSHEPRLQQISDDLAKGGWHPFHAPWGSC